MFANWCQSGFNPTWSTQSKKAWSGYSQNENLVDWSKPSIFDEELEFVLKVDNQDSQSSNGYIQNTFVLYTKNGGRDTGFSTWFSLAPQGYVALGYVVSVESMQLPPYSGLCILVSFLFFPCALRDCITMFFTEPNQSNLASW